MGNWLATLSRWGRIRATDRPPFPPSPFPIHRCPAIQHLRQSDEAPAKMMLEYISSENVNSFLLPINGTFIDHRTPLTVSTAAWRFPYPAFILEYSTSPEWCNRGSAEIWSPTRSLLLFKWQADASLRMWAVWADASWSVAPVGIEFGVDSRIEVNAEGKVNATDLSVLTMPGDKKFSKDEQQALIGEYVHEYLVLAQFLTIFRAEGIRPRRVASPTNAPGEYYVLSCEDSTRFAWLPASGMRA